MVVEYIATCSPGSKRNARVLVFQRVQHSITNCCVHVASSEGQVQKSHADHVEVGGNCDTWSALYAKHHDQLHRCNMA